MFMNVVIIEQPQQQMCYLKENIITNFVKEVLSNQEDHSGHYKKLLIHWRFYGQSFGKSHQSRRSSKFPYSLRHYNTDTIFERL